MPSYTSSSNLKKYQSKNPLAKFLLNNFYSEIYGLIEFCLPIKNLVDVGCGEGFGIYRLQRKFSGESFTITGVDISKKSLEICKKMNPSVPLYEGDIYKLPFASKKFEMVMCLETLEHLEHPEVALEELCRVSKKYLLLSVPNEPLFSLSTFIRGKYMRNFGRLPEHLQFWSSGKFIKLISKRTKLKKVRKPFPWAIVLCEPGNGN